MYEWRTRIWNFENDYNYPVKNFGDLNRLKLRNPIDIISMTNPIILQHNPNWNRLISDYWIYSNISNRFFPIISGYHRNLIHDKIQFLSISIHRISVCLHKWVLIRVTLQSLTRVYSWELEKNTFSPNDDSNRLAFFIIVTNF